jgi:hypothetical protein
MSAPLSLTDLDTAAAELMAAQAHYVEVATETATTKANLEYRRAELLCEGIDGKNAEQREATLRLTLSDEYAELSALENELTRVRCCLERAQVAFTAIRYKVRLLEVLKGVA